MIVARVCARTGWTWDYVNETLEVSRLKALEKHWGGEPPTDILVAAFMGFKKDDVEAAAGPTSGPLAPAKGTSTPKKTKAANDAAISELLGLFPGGVIK